MLALCTITICTIAVLEKKVFKKKNHLYFYVKRWAPLEAQLLVQGSWFSQFSQLFIIHVYISFSVKISISGSVVLASSLAKGSRFAPFLTISWHSLLSNVRIFFLDFDWVLLKPFNQSKRCKNISDLIDKVFVLFTSVSNTHS